MGGFYSRCSGTSALEMKPLCHTVKEICGGVHGILNHAAVFQKWWCYQGVYCINSTGKKYLLSCLAKINRGEDANVLPESASVNI